MESCLPLRTVVSLPFRILAVFVVCGGAAIGQLESALTDTDAGLESSLPAVPTEGLSLRRSIELALANNRTIEKASLDRETQQFDLKVALDEFVPNLDLSAGVHHNPVRSGDESTTTRSGSFAAEVTQDIPTGGRVAVVWETDATDVSTRADGTDYGSSAFLRFNQPLLRGGGLGANLANIRIARLSEESNVLEFRRTLINTITDVVLSYRQFLKAKLQLETTRAALKRAREQLTVNSALVDAGILPPVEIIQTEANIASQEFNVLTAEGAYESSRFKLIKLLDIDRESNLDPTDPITIPEFALSLDTARELAYENRPEILQAKAAVDIAKYRVDIAENDRRWDLDFESRYRISGSGTRLGSSLDDTFSRRDEDWAVGLVLDIPIGDLTPRQRALRARSQAAKAELDLVEVRENTEIEIRDDFRAIEISRERVRVAAVARKLAERKLEIERGKLQAGRTTNFAVVTFENDLLRARLNEISAQIGLLDSLTSLDQTLGTTLQRWNIVIRELSNGGAPRTALGPPVTETSSAPAP